MITILATLSQSVVGVHNNLTICYNEKVNKKKKKKEKKNIYKEFFFFQTILKNNQNFVNHQTENRISSLSR